MLANTWTYSSLSKLGTCYSNRERVNPDQKSMYALTLAEMHASSLIVDGLNPKLLFHPDNHRSLRNTALSQGVRGRELRV